MQPLWEAIEMRAIFGVLGLVAALGIVVWLAKTQLAPSRRAIPLLAVPGADKSSAPASGAREPSQQIQQQVKQSLDAAMQQARPEPADQ